MLRTTFWIALAVAAALPSAVAARGTAARAVLVSIDGLRADAIAPERTPRLQSLLASGAATLEARSLSPTLTVPNHVSMLTGLLPATHGLLGEEDLRDFWVDGTILQIVHATGRRTALYASKEKLRGLGKPGAVDRAFLGSGESSRPAVDAFLADVTKPEECPALTFLHLIEPDAAGHRHGWMSGPYQAAVALADAQLGRIIDRIAALRLMPTTLLVVTADHGGLGTGHVEDAPEVRDVPWIAVGPGVRHGTGIERRVAVNDTAPTIIEALGIEALASMEGTAVLEVLGPDLPRFVRGDVDADGRVSRTDVRLLLEHLFMRREAACPAAGDADLDTRLTVTDAILLLGFLDRGDAAPPPPFRDCSEGTDGTAIPCAPDACRQ